MNYLIPERETLEIEFKSDYRKLSDSDLIDAVVAFANTNGGDLYLGVEDDGSVTGLHKDHKDITQLSAFIANKTIPPISVRAEFFECSDSAVLIIHVPRSRSIVASSNGKIQRRRLKADGTPENVPIHSKKYAGSADDCVDNRASAKDRDSYAFEFLTDPKRFEKESTHDHDGDREGNNDPGR